MNKHNQKTNDIFKRRQMILLSGIFVLFSILVIRLYNLQVIEGEEHLANIRTTTMKTVSIEAQRGNIYDRWGIPLAENSVSFSLKLDLSVTDSNIDKVILNIIKLMKENGENLVNDFPITIHEPYEFTFSSDSAEMRWKTDMGLKNEQLSFTPYETLNYFYEKFEVPNNISLEERFLFLSLKSQIHLQRYRKYNAITIAKNIGYKTISAVEEHYKEFSGAYIEADSERVYTQGEAFSHILGYVGSINEDELKEYGKYGYTGLDKIGKIGIEKSYELTLNGVDGKKMIEVDAMGKRISEEEIEKAVNGGDVFLTIDSKLQKKTAEILKTNLKSILLSRLDSGEITKEQILKSMEKNKAVSTEEIEKLKNVSSADIKKKILNDEITVNEINMDPCTGSVVVLDVNSGEILSLVTYPTYDNNQLVNEFNNEYYKKLLNDSTTPLINRPVMERKAPGSVLKMMSAVAGLEAGVINEDTYIRDKGIYKDAGSPYAKCLIYSRYGITHGDVDVRKALEVSCNYFFYELAYRLGNASEGTTLNSIETFDLYMEKFGLSELSGIEIEESMPKIASPQAKRENIENNYPESSESKKSWMDGDSIRCAIGQSYNNFSAINIAKYISTLANGGTRYKTSIVLGKQAGKTDDIEYNISIVEENLDLKKDTIKAVKEGMYLVTHGSQGSLRNYFNSFPIEVAAKTGTAEEADSRPSHSWFAGFAPYDEPQIAVVVMIPFGESSFNPGIKTAEQVIEEYFGLNNKPALSGKFKNSFAQ